MYLLPRRVRPMGGCQRLRQGDGRWSPGVSLSFIAASSLALWTMIALVIRVAV